MQHWRYIISAGRSREVTMLSEVTHGGNEMKKSKTFLIRQENLSIFSRSSSILFVAKHIYWSFCASVAALP
jgi:hypothetical protein